MTEPLPEEREHLRELISRQEARLAALERQIGRLSSALRTAGIALPPVHPAHASTSTTTPPTPPVLVPCTTEDTASVTGGDDSLVVVQGEAAFGIESLPVESAATSAPEDSGLPPPPSPLHVQPAAQGGFPAGAMKPFAPVPPVILREADFMTSAEAHAESSTQSEHAAGGPRPFHPPRQSGAGLEAALAMRLLPIVGGILLLFGGVFLASLIGAAMPPGGRVAIGYFFAVVLAGLGAFAHRKSETVGRLVTAIALAFAYLVSFAAHFIPPTKCLSLTASLFLMAGFAAGIVVFAEKWKSEGTAIFAFGLGMLAALLSTDTAGGFGLIALVIISVGAGVLLVRNEWIRLTILTLLGCYTSYAGLWILEPPERGAEALRVNFLGLLASHTVFTIAFWRWGRPWIARELAFEEMAAHEAAPQVAFGLIPYSTAYSILNSLGFIGLALYLAWVTNTNSGGADKLFYTLAVIEGARLLVPSLRRGGLHSFHGLTAIALATSGLMVTFAGTTESAMLASECLILCVAASRAPMLRVLRPFSAICGFLAARELSYSGTTGADLTTALIPGFLVLLSTISWDNIFVRLVRTPEMGALFQIERISSNLRALTAAGMVAGVLEGHRTAVPLEVSAPFASAVLGVLALLLRARPWTLALHLGLVVTLGAFADGMMTGQRLVLFATWGAIAGFVCAETARRTRSRLGAIEGILATGIGAIAMFGVTGHTLREMTPYMGASALLLGAAFAAGSVAVLFLNSIPALVQDRFVEVPSRTIGMSDMMRVLVMNPAAGLAAGALTVAAAAAATTDARLSLVSAGLFAVLFTFAWFMLTGRESRLPVAEGVIVAMLLAVFCPAVIVRMLFTSASLALVFVILCAVGFATIWRRSATGAGVTGLALAAIPLAAPVLQEIPGREAPFVAGPAIATCLACVVLSRTIRGITDKLMLSDVWARLPGFLAGWLVVTSSITLLGLTAGGGTLSPTLVTVAWAGYGIGLLVAGLTLVDAPMRFTSLAIFAAAVARVFMVDLANANLIVKAVAATGVGVVLILAGVGYGVFRRRMQESADDAPNPESFTEPPSQQ